MEHKAILELLPAYVDQELDLSKSLTVGRHLDSCADCQRAYEEQRAISARLRKDAVHFDAPAHLVRRINTALPLGRLRFIAFKRWGFSWFNVGAGLTALAAVAWSLGLYLSLPPAGERLTEDVVSSHVRSLQANHLLDMASSDQHTVKPWFNGKLNFSPPVVDLAPQGFVLEGGRLDYIKSRPVAALVYRHNRHPINLYIWPSADKDAPLRLQNRQGYQLVRWARGGMDYWAISDLAANELENFAKALQYAEFSGAQN